MAAYGEHPEWHHQTKMIATDFAFLKEQSEKQKEEKLKEFLRNKLAEIRKEGDFRKQDTFDLSPKTEIDDDLIFAAEMIAKDMRENPKINSVNVRRCFGDDFDTATLMIIADTLATQSAPNLAYLTRQKAQIRCV